VFATEGFRYKPRMREPNPLLKTKVGRKRIYQPAILDILQWGAARPVDIHRAMGFPQQDKWGSHAMLNIIRWLRAMEKVGQLRCTRTNHGAYYQLAKDPDPCLVPTQEERKERAAVTRRLTREAWHRSHPEITDEPRAAAMSLAAAWPERS
jgi:hypothetical protein